MVSYVHEMNNLISYVSLTEFLSFRLMLCALLFLLAIIDNIIQNIIIILYILLILTQSFAIYYYANELHQEVSHYLDNYIIIYTNKLFIKCKIDYVLNNAV